MVLFFTCRPIIHFEGFFYYLFLAALCLHCCARALSSFGEQGPLHCAAQASHCYGFSCCGVRALGVQASVVVAHGLSTCGLRL